MQDAFAKSSFLYRLDFVIPSFTFFKYSFTFFPNKSLYSKFNGSRRRWAGVYHGVCYFENLVSYNHLLKENPQEHIDSIGPG